jgi:hypothetical protein
MKTILWWLAASCLVCLSANGQDEISVETYRVIENLDHPEIIESLVLIHEQSKPKLGWAAIIEIPDTAQHALVKVTQPGSIQTIPTTKLDKLRYLLRGSGKYVVDVTTFSTEAGFSNKVVEIELGKASPSPGPDPPNPDPPNPDDPLQPVKSLTVLVVYETSLTPNLPRSQLAIFQNSELRQWLNQVCSIDAATRQPNYRFFDKDQAFPPQCDSVWCQLMGTGASQRTQLPWLEIADGPNRVWAGPLPQSVEEFKSLISKYKGANRVK